MAFSRDKINKIIGKMKSKSSRNGITESMAQVLQDILSDDELGQSHINPESAFRLIRAKSETELFVKTAAEVQQNEEWYVIATDSTGTFASKAKNYVKKDEDGNFIFETAKNSDVIVFYDDEHNDLDASNKHIRGIHVYEGGVWIAINARFTNYNSANSTASGDYANVEGSGNTASGESAHAEGNATTASGMAAHSEGTNTDAAAIAAHAEGSDTKALGNSSHAEGRNTLASGAGSSAHGYNTIALPESTAVFGSHAKIGNPDTYFGVGFSENNYRLESDKTDANDHNLHLSIKKDGSVLNKDGNKFITEDAVADEIDEKLDVYSGEGAADSLFNLIQVAGSSAIPPFANPSIVIEASKNGSPVYVRYSDENEFFEFLNYLKGKEIHLIESGETVSDVSITFTGFSGISTYTEHGGYKSRQIIGFTGTKFNKTTGQDENIVMAPSTTTNVQYYYNKHTPIRLLVDNNSNHIRSIEQALTVTGNADDAATLLSAQEYADTGDETTLTAAKQYTDENAGGDTNHFVRVVRKQGTAIGDKDYYVENTADIALTDEYYIVNPAGGGNIPAANNGNYAIKASDNTITYTAPNNGDTALIYNGGGTVKKIEAILIYEGGTWLVTEAGFKNAKNVTETGSWANAEGSATHATGTYAHAEGTGSTAGGNQSHAEGYFTDATAHSSHAEGRNTLASGVNSHAQGNKTTANKPDTAIMGKNGVVGNSSTVAGIAWGSSEPSSAQITGDADVGLVWKVDQTGNTTQTGKVVADSFEKSDGTAIGAPDLSAYSTTEQVDAKDQVILAAAKADATAKDGDSYDVISELISDGDAATLSSAQTFATNADATQKGVLQALFYERAKITELDTATLNAAKAYTDANAGSGSGADKALEALVYDMEWVVDIQTFDVGTVPAGTGVSIGLSYAVGGNGTSGTVDFIFPIATNKAAVDALVLNRNFAFKTTAGVIEFTPTAYTATAAIDSSHHRERYLATFALDSGVNRVSATYNTETPTLYRATASSGSSSGKHVSTAAVTNGKVVLGYSDGSTAIESAQFLPSPANQPHARVIVTAARNASSEINLTATISTDVINTLNTISAGNANTTGLQGHVLRNDTIAEAKLDPAVVTKLNANSPDLSDYATTAATNTKISGIKIKERTKRVFANSALKTTDGDTGGWLFKGSYTNLLAVGNLEETPPDDDSLQFKGLSIAILKTEWDKMDKVVVTATHSSQVAYSPYFIYKEDIPSGEANKVRLGVSGTGRTKMNIYFEESKNQENTANNDNNRLVIEMLNITENSIPGFYIGEVLLQHLETTTT